MSRPYQPYFVQILLAAMLALIGVACERHDAPKIISVTHHDSLIFEAVDTRKGVNHVTELAELPPLRREYVKDGDIELRVWRGFGLEPLEGVVLRREGGIAVVFAARRRRLREGRYSL